MAGLPYFPAKGTSCNLNSYVLATVSLLTSRFLFGTALCLSGGGTKENERGKGAGGNEKMWPCGHSNYPLTRKPPNPMFSNSVRGQLLKYPDVISEVKGGSLGK